MRKKLAILAFAGVMLFSGLNVFAETGICPHPTLTYFANGRTRIDGENCKDPEHENCRVETEYYYSDIYCVRCFEYLGEKQFLKEIRHVSK